MRLLLTGANGFIGSHLVAGLVARNHAVVAAVRDVQGASRRWPGIETVAVDFNRDTSPDLWRSRLAGVDAVINCAGVLHGGRGQDVESIHARTPMALFDACVLAGVRKVVQISAISADDAVGTAYATTKKRADDHLRALPLDWTVLRPSLVYGDGSYGGTSTLRGLAGLPLITPLPGDGAAAFRPLHVDDLVETVARAIEGTDLGQRTLEPVGPQRLTLREIVARYRRWLGLPPALPVRIPLQAMRLLARLADVAGGGPMGSAGLRQALAANAGHEPPGVFEEAAGFRPTSMDERLLKRPAQTQDLWHARLYFLRPALRLALAALWLGSGIAGLVAPLDGYAALASKMDRAGLPAGGLAVFFSLLDVAIAAALVLRVRPRLIGAIQFALVAGYTLALGLLVPALWLEPLGPLVKNLPILAAIAAWTVLEQER